MSNVISILVVGLDFDWSQANRGTIGDIAAIRAKVEQGIQNFNATPGLTADLYAVIPDKKELYDEVDAKLRNGYDGKPWTGVIIGWGVRGFEDMTPLFEKLVNFVRETSPTSKMLFTVSGALDYDVIERNFPQFRRPS